MSIHNLELLFGGVSRTNLSTSSPEHIYHFVRISIIDKNPNEAWAFLLQCAINNINNK